MTHAAGAGTTRPSTRAQWGAVLVAAALMVVLGLGLPRLADSTTPTDTAVAAGDQAVAGGIAVTVPEGWALAGGTDLLVLNKADTKFFVLPPSASTQSPEDAVAQSAAGYGSDASLGAQIGEVQSFTTDGGLEAASVTIVQPDLVTVWYAFSDGESLASGSATSTPASWPDVKDEVDDMAATVEFASEASS